MVKEKVEEKAEYHLGKKKQTRQRRRKGGRWSIIRKEKQQVKSMHRTAD
jgi:hypothetical protein